MSVRQRPTNPPNCTPQSTQSCWPSKPRTSAASAFSAIPNWSSRSSRSSPRRCSMPTPLCSHCCLRPSPRSSSSQFCRRSFLPRFVIALEPIAFYERGLARLNDRWAGTGETGERFLDPAHPYARDLDLFGAASLFEYLSSARTRAGEETLAHWLLTAALPDEILARQDAVRELHARVKFRERLFSAGETVRLGVHPEALSAWGEARPVFAGRSVRITVSVLAVLWILSLIGWAVWDLPVVALLMTVLNFAYSHHIHARLEKAAGSLENAAKDLQLLARCARAHRAGTGFLREACRHTDGIAASRINAIRGDRQAGPPGRPARIKAQPFCPAARPGHVLECATRLRRGAMAAGVRSRHSRTGCSPSASSRRLLRSLPSRIEHPLYAFPAIAGEGPLFEAEGLAHPLLPAGKAVDNDLKLSDEMQLVILSGPNMAGKSTFIRAIGVNAVLAQCGAPVRARSLRISPLQVAASICILDSLAGGISRFYAEIHRLKLIADLTQGGRTRTVSAGRIVIRNQLARPSYRHAICTARICGASRDWRGQHPRSGAHADPDTAWRASRQLPLRGPHRRRRSDFRLQTEARHRRNQQRTEAHARNRPGRDGTLMAAPNYLGGLEHTTRRFAQCLVQPCIPASKLRRSRRGSARPTLSGKSG